MLVLYCDVPVSSILQILDHIM